jgi:hypothetical protein
MRASLLGLVFVVSVTIFSPVRGFAEDTKGGKQIANNDASALTTAAIIAYCLNIEKKTIATDCDPYKGSDPTLYYACKQDAFNDYQLCKEEMGLFVQALGVGGNTGMAPSK